MSGGFVTVFGILGLMVESGVQLVAGWLPWVMIAVALGMTIAACSPRWAGAPAAAPDAAGQAGSLGARHGWLRGGVRDRFPQLLPAAVPRGRRQFVHAPRHMGGALDVPRLHARDGPLRHRRRGRHDDGRRERDATRARRVTGAADGLGTRPHGVGRVPALLLGDRPARSDASARRWRRRSATCRRR